MSDSISDRHQKLIDGFCFGTLSDDEFAELEELLRENLAIRRELLHSRMFDSDLRDYATASTRNPVAPESRSISPRQRPEIWAMAAAIAILLAGVAFLALRSNDAVVPANAQMNFDPGVAVLTRAIDAKWQNRSPRTGDSMAPGNWKLVSGSVEIEFYNGASVILEAPTELEILSENGGILHAGKLRAEVPHHAQGFTIQTKAIELVDLGTSFGIEVSKNMATEVHVFDGVVELYEPGTRGKAAGQPVLAGEGRTIGATGEMSTIPADGSRFLDPAEIGKDTTERFTRWQDGVAALNQNSAVVARFDFEPDQPPSRTLRNRSPNQHAGLDGSIIGARWSSGRWPQKRALDFKRPGDRVRVEVPGTTASATLVAWLRIDGFDNGFHSILLSDGWDRTGALHWQIHKDGFVELAVWHDGKTDTYNSRASFVIEPSDFGRWLQLAVIYNGETGTVTHFRDGEVKGTVKVEKVVPVAIGKAEIGNWTPPAHDARQIRNFNGRIDELVIFNEAMSTDEISAIYESGKP